MEKFTFGSFYTRQPTRDIFYRHQINFNVQHFLIDLETNVILERQYSDHVSFDKLRKIFKYVREKHALMKKQKVRENQTSFTAKQLTKSA